MQYLTSPMIEKLVKIGADLVNNLGSVQLINQLVNETLYHGCRVIDLIAILDIADMLENKIMDTIVSGYWESPFLLLRVGHSTVGVHITESLENCKKITLKDLFQAETNFLGPHTTPYSFEAFVYGLRIRKIF